MSKRFINWVTWHHVILAYVFGLMLYLGVLPTPWTLLTAAGMLLSQVLMMSGSLMCGVQLAKAFEKRKKKK